MLFLRRHHSKEGHKLDLIRKDGRASIELECNVNLVSGGDTPCCYTSTYASLIASGRATIVEAEEEKSHALNMLIKNQTGRQFALDSNMTKSVAVIKIVSAAFTAKAREATNKF